MSDWHQFNLAELGQFRNGANFSKDAYGKGYPIVNVKHLFSGRFVSADNLRELDVGALNNPDRLFLQFGDILFARSSVVASGAGQVSMVNELPRGSIFSGFIIRFRPTRTDLVDPLFLNYLLRSPIYRERLVRTGTGTSITNLSQDILGRLPVRLPNLDTQRLLAGILNNLDDKIELNRETARTLEELAQRLFKSWFVDFDPVRAKMAGRQPAHMPPETAALFPDKLVDSTLGPMPEDWDVGELSDVAEQVRDSVKADEIQADSLYVGLEHFAPKHLILADSGRGEEVSSNKSRFHRGDLLFGKLRPYFHKVAVAHADGICSTDVLVIRPKYEEYRAFCYLAFSQEAVVDYATQRSTGTRMPRANWKTLSEFPVAIPSVTIGRGFNSLALSIIDRLFLLRQESGTLAELRDRLLPKLISGEIRVPEAQEIAEEA